MKHIIQQFAETIVENSNGTVMSYSGRGMHGEKCLGIEINDSNVFLFELGMKIGCMQKEIVEGDSFIVYEYEGYNISIPNNLTIRTDSMGHDIIVYFPQIKFFDENQNQSQHD